MHLIDESIGSKRSSLMKQETAMDLLQSLVDYLAWEPQTCLQVASCLTFLYGDRKGIKWWHAAGLEIKGSLIAWD